MNTHHAEEQQRGLAAAACGWLQMIPLLPSDEIMSGSVRQWRHLMSSLSTFAEIMSVHLISSTATGCGAGSFRFHLSAGIMNCFNIFVFATQQYYALKIILLVAIVSSIS